MGRSGRNIVVSKLPDLIKKHQIDFVVANGENSAGGLELHKLYVMNYSKSEWM